MEPAAPVDGSASCTLAGARIVADPSGAILLRDARVLVVADLHFEKGSAFAARGDAWLPPYDTSETLARLERLCRHHQPQRVVCLGDSFHDLGGPGRMAAGDLARLRRLVARHDWVWITGNHDPAPPSDLGGMAAEALDVGRLTLRHEAATGMVPSGEISGHFHPKAAVRTRGRRISGRCFVTDGHRLILPAFGAFTGGLNVLDPALAALLQPAFRVFVIGKQRLFAYPHHQLAPEPPRL
ncbi:MAG: ligase-associated DNA damage response endonuclease PdeM [Alphaproteobacteria bacterium]|nr:ligase-associated DNA damage response endonuclease PdeM [Alphaproteobacteria bacterium]